MLTPLLDARVTRLLGALRAHAADPFAASLADRLEQVLDAADPRDAVRRLVDGADLAGLERLRPSEEATATLVDLLREAHALHPPMPAPDALRLPPTLWWLTAVGAFWLGWVARTVAAVRR